MSKLFHITGRAWSFLTAHLPGQHFVIEHGGQVTDFLEKACADLRQIGDIEHTIQDIEGCFPNMPKDAIKYGLRDITLLKVRPSLPALLHVTSSTWLSAAAVLPAPAAGLGRHLGGYWAAF